MDADEFDLSDWTVVDEDVGDSGNSSNKTHANSKTDNRRCSSNVRGLDNSTKSKSVNKPENRSGTSPRNLSSNETSSKTNVASKDVAKSAISSGVQAAGRKVIGPVVSSSTSEARKNVVQSASCTSTAGPGKSDVESPEGDKLTGDCTTHSGRGSTISCLETVQGTSLKATPGRLAPVSDVASISHPISGQSKSDLPVVTEMSSSITPSSTVSSIPLKEGTSEAVSSKLSSSPLTSVVPSALMLNSTENKLTDKKVTRSQEAASKPESALISTQSTAKPVASAISMTPVTSTVSSTNQLASQTSSVQTLTKSSTHMKDKSVDVESIAEIMAAVGKEDAHKTRCDAMDDVSEAELTAQKSKVAGLKRDASPNKGGPAIKKAKVQYSKSSAGSTQVPNASAARNQPAGLPVKKDQSVGPAVKKDQPVGPAVKKEQSVGPAVKKDQPVGPAVKKDQPVGPAVKKDQSVGTAVKKDQQVGPAVKKDQQVDPAVKKDQPVGPAVKKDQQVGPAVKKDQPVGPAVKKDQPVGPAVKKYPAQSDQNNERLKQQKQGNKSEENIKVSARSQIPGGMSSTPKGSSGTGKTPATKMKTPPGVSPVSTKVTTASATAKTNDADNKPGTTSSTTVKRIIRRFHRMTQTMSTEHSNKLVQCLIKIPSLDAPPKPNCHSEVQVSIENAKDGVFYQKPLPETVRPEIFKVVSTFKVDDPGSRNIVTGSYGYGISFGHVTAVDLEKSMFRENLLAKSAYYSLSFNRQDFGVVDLFFGEEEHFVAVLTQIRKMKIGPRHLVVTYCKHLKESDRAPESSVSSVKVTIIYNQNFATTNFLAHTKAPLWNKPKVEEILTIHNMPEGIPLDFLKLIIPDALSVELDDKKQKFTQKGSRVHLGMDRKKGGDGFLKLFTQMYINNECLAFSVAGTAVSGDPDLTAILAEKKNRENEMNNQRELKAVSRDISSTPYVGEEKEVEVIMQVETVASVEKILSLPTWTGPSTVHKPVGPPKSNKNPIGDNSALSDVSDELSDISDTSNIGGATAVPKTGPKNTSSAQRKPATVANRTSRVQHRISSTQQTEKRGCKLVKTSGLTSKNIERRREIRERLQDKNQRRFLSRPLDRSFRGVRSDRPQIHVDNERHDRFSRVSNSERGKERSTHRQNIPENRVHDETETSREERSHRDQAHVESARRGSFDRVSSHRDHRRNAEDRGRHSHSSSKTERTSHKSEENNSRRLTVDRHGKKIVNYYKRKQFNRKIHGSEENESEKFSHSKMDSFGGYHERDRGKGNRLDLLVQKRLGSLERQEREADDSRQVILTRSQSPITRQVYRGSPKKYQPMSVRLRHTSPSAVYGSQLRFSSLRRSRSPQQASHSSVLSPISAGEDEADEATEGMWLPQPPATLASQQDMRKSSLSSRFTNYVKSQAEWKSQISADDESEKKTFIESQSAKFIERFVQEVIGTGRASARSDTTSEKLPTKQFHDPATVIEKIREIYNSGLNLNEKVSDSEEDEILNTAVSSRSQKLAERAGQAPSKSILKLPSNTSSSLSHDKDLKPVDRFEGREKYERNSRGTGDALRFDVPVNNRGKFGGNEAGTTSSQANSRGYAESRATNQPNFRDYAESRPSNRPDSREYADSRASNQSNSRGFAESRPSDQPNSRGYVESRASDRPHSREYVESRASDRPNSREYADSRASDRSNSERYGESRASDRLNSRGYVESRISDQQNSRGFVESRASDQPNSRGYAEPKVSDEPNSSRFREPGIANYSTYEEYQESGMQDQTKYGQNREPELPDWPNSGRYSEFGMPNSGGFRQPDTPYQQNLGGFRESQAPYKQNSGGFRETEALHQQNSGGFRETGALHQQNPGRYRELEEPYEQNTGRFRELEAPYHPGSGDYHQNQNEPSQLRIGQPIVAPQGNSMQSAEEQLVQLENMAQIIAAGMEQNGQGASNPAPEMWNTPSQQASTSGPQAYTASPQTYTAGPLLYSTGQPFSFSGPQPPHGPNMNFSGPPPPPAPPNVHQSFLRGANPQSAPWPQSNFF